MKAVHLILIPLELCTKYRLTACKLTGTSEIQIAAGGELFPFDLKHHMIDAPIDLDFLEMAESVKMRTRCPIQNGILSKLIKVVSLTWPRLRCKPASAHSMELPSRIVHVPS